MSSASRALRRSLDVRAAFAEAQGAGRRREWLEGVRVADPGPLAGLGQGAGLRAWHARRAAEFEQKRAVVVGALYAGASRVEAARRAGVAVSTAKAIAHEAGFFLRTRPPPGRDEALVRAVVSGMSLREAGRRFDIAAGSVPYVLRKHGVRVGLKGRAGGRRGPRGPAPGAVVSALLEGLSYRQAARRLGTSTSVVGRVARGAILNGLLPARRPGRPFGWRKRGAS